MILKLLQPIRCDTRFEVWKITEGILKISQDDAKGIDHIVSPLEKKNTVFSKYESKQ